MKIKTIHIVFFSPAYSTKKVVNAVAESLAGAEIIRYDITQNVPVGDVILDSSDLLLAAVPSYGGRVPSGALAGLNRFRGEDTPAVLMCVYGNREYDDTLLELYDTVRANGFKSVSAGAFIAQHSIMFPVAANRPDEKDLEQIRIFGKRTAELLSHAEDVSLLPEIRVKGSRPYKIPGKVPLYPSGDKKCDRCGICVKLCPAQAVPEGNPRQTDKAKCISCGRCVKICPAHSRHWGGLVYKIAAGKFIKAYSRRKEPETVYALPVEGTE